VFRSSYDFGMALLAKAEGLKDIIVIVARQYVR